MELTPQHQKKNVLGHIPLPLKQHKSQKNLKPEERQASEEKHLAEVSVLRASEISTTVLDQNSMGHDAKLKQNVGLRVNFPQQAIFAAIARGVAIAVVVSMVCSKSKGPVYSHRAMYLEGLMVALIFRCVWKLLVIFELGALHCHLHLIHKLWSQSWQSRLKMPSEKRE